MKKINKWLNLLSKKARCLDWLRDDGRYTTFRSAVRLVNYEMIPGDIVEFGVADGKSLAMLALLHQENLIQDNHKDEVTKARRLVGFDSFEGLPADKHQHPRWWKGIFSHNINNLHPFLKLNDKVTPEVVKQLFQYAGITSPLLLEPGWFDQNLPGLVPKKYSKIALVHIDCDLYESTQAVLNNLEPALQTGSVILWDDWFCYKANPNKGEAAAFRDFLKAHPHWEAIPFRTYATHCNSFIMYDKRSS